MYAEAFSFNCRRHRWQLQLPGGGKKGGPASDLLIPPSPYRQGCPPASLGLPPHLQGAQPWEDSGSTCGSPGHSHRRTTAGPGEGREKQRSQVTHLFSRCLGWGEPGLGLQGPSSGPEPPTSFSEVPHKLQLLHSMHCHRYVRTAAVMFTVNCRQEGCPGRENLRGSTSEPGGGGLCTCLEVLCLLLDLLCGQAPCPTPSNAPWRPRRVTPQSLPPTSAPPSLLPVGKPSCRPPPLT